MPETKMQVLLFGIARELVGNSRIEVENGKVSSVGGLKEWLGLKYPSLNKLSSIAVAVDSEYATDDQKINEENEIALIPPVSGG